MALTTQYLAASTAFVVLGTWLFVFVRRWYQHLNQLAKRYDLQKRRSLAALDYALLLPFLLGPVLAVLLGLIEWTEVNKVFLVLGFALSVTPALTWWWPRMSVLKRLGYGRQSPSAR